MFGSYPAAPRQELFDDYHGIKVADPFRQLEDAGTSRDQWLAAQEALRQRVLPDHSLVPWQAQLRKLRSGSYNLLGKYGQYWFSLQSGEKFPLKILARSRTISGRSKTVVNPNLWAGAGQAQIGTVKISPDGKLALLGISWNGQDKLTWSLIDTSTGTTLPDEVFGHSHVWLPDSSGYCYIHETHTAVDGEQPRIAWSAVWRHALGTVNQEVCLCSGKGPYRWTFEVLDQRWLVVRDGLNALYNTSGLMLKDLTTPSEAPLIRVADGDVDIWRTLGAHAGEAFFRTTCGAGRGRIVAVKLPEEVGEVVCVREVVPEGDGVLVDAVLSGGKLLVHHAEVEGDRLSIHATDGGSAQPVSVPSGCAVVSRVPAGKNGLLLALTGMSFKGYWTRIDMRSGNWGKKYPPQFAREDLQVKIVCAGVIDGIPVYMRLLGRAETFAAGVAPLVLSGYGGFRNLQRPSFKTVPFMWAEKGGIWAEAILPGDGLLGEEQHLAGIRAKKQNCVDALAMCARWLVSEGFTTCDQLALTGASNGGWLIGAVITQYPAICRAALILAGVLDLMRFVELGGKTWSHDYGSRDDPNELGPMITLSPVHNVRRGEEYPSVLVVTGDHDDRVLPANSYKFVAALQEAQAGDGEIVLANIPGTGHSMDTSEGTAALVASLGIEFLSRQLCRGQLAVA